MLSQQILEMNEKVKVEFDSFNKTKKLYSELQQVGSPDLSFILCLL